MQGALKHRISYLDGHRGIAILLVLLYHSYSRWPEIVPYGDDYAHFPLFSGGWLGVHLFFLISGFVILMTLDKCKSISEFLYRRLLRLFPAMLICSLFVFFTAGFFHERPMGSPVPRDLLPGLTFIEPEWWEQLLGPPQGFIEEAFWSLYVEIKFYIVASLLYFWWGRKAQTAILFGLFISTEMLELLVRYEPVYALTVTNDLFHQLSFDYFGWFAAGASFYLYASSSEKKWLYSGTAMALLSAGFVQNDFYIYSIVAATAVALFFAASVYSKRLQKLISNRVLLFLGFVSYPLYLMHENMMVSMIIKLGNYLPDALHFILPTIPILIITGLAYVVARFLETPLQSLIRWIINISGKCLYKIKPGTKVGSEG